MKYLYSVSFFVLAFFCFQPVFSQVLDVSVANGPNLSIGTHLARKAVDDVGVSEAKGARVSEVQEPALSVVEGWKAGVAKMDITPEEPMWMAGYGARTSPSKGTLQPIWVKALSLEDARGHQSVLLTADLLGWPKDLSEDIRSKIENKYGLGKAQVILNSSHTHSGPVLSDALFDIYPLDDAEHKKIGDYSNDLRDRVVALVGKSLKEMETVSLYSGNGVARFQVNRRNNDEATQERITDLNGPNDYAVPVIKVEKSDGSLMAIVFGYACHPTVLSINQWSGDYPGFAQIELEKDHPGAQVMFFQGGGADQNPIPRRTIPLARQYGRTLAAAVDRVLEEKMKPLESNLATAYTEVDLNLNMPPSIEELTRHCEISSSYQKRWGERMLEEAKSGEKFRESYPFPLQVWKVGEQSIFILGGELLIGYSIRLKEIFGYDSFVMGYSNDVMGYIPTSRVLHEGGYEGASAQVVYGLPAKWAYDIESNIIHGMVELAKSIGLRPPEKKLINN